MVSNGRETTVIFGRLTTEDYSDKVAADPRIDELRAKVSTFFTSTRVMVSYDRCNEVSLTFARLSCFLFRRSDPMCRRQAIHRRLP